MIEKLLKLTAIKQLPSTWNCPYQKWHTWKKKSPENDALVERIKTNGKGRVASICASHMSLL